MDDRHRMIIGGESSGYEQNEGDSSLSNARDSRLLGFDDLNDRTVIRKATMKYYISNRDSSLRAEQLETGL
jgi:hypothetical protein